MPRGVGMDTGASLPAGLHKVGCVGNQMGPGESELG